MRRTLVIGVGYVGGRVLASSAEGSCIGLSRSPVDEPQPVEVFDLDGSGPIPLEFGAEYSILYTVPPFAGSDSDERLQRFVGRLEPSPACFVYISSTGVYGDSDGALVNEGSIARPTTDRARRRLAAEQILQSWSESHSVRLCILRVPGIYGPDRLGIERVQERRPVIRESDSHPGNRIHVDDLVSCCLAALDNENAAGLFNVGDGDFRSSTWFAQEVARQAGLPALPEISRNEAARVFPARRMSFLSESRRIDARRMREVLGITPRYADAADGIRASLQGTADP